MTKNRIWFLLCVFLVSTMADQIQGMNYTEYYDEVEQAMEIGSAQNITTEDVCVCDYHSTIDKATIMLKENVKSTQIRLAGLFREAIAYASSEKMILINFAKYQVLKEIQHNYESLLNHTEFMESFEEFMQTISRVLVTDTSISSAGIKYEVTSALHNFLRRIVPSTFMCLTFGKCRSVPINYLECMSRNTDNWKEYLGDSPMKMANSVADTIYRYRKTEALLIDMHTQLMGAQNATITEECIKSYANISCDCKTESQFCEFNSLCIRTRDICFGDFNREWDAKLFLMKNMTSGFLNNNGFLVNFMKIKKSLSDALRHLTERKSAAYAEHLTKTCGVPSEMLFHQRKQEYTLVVPPKFHSRAEIAVRELQLSMKTWEKLNENTCKISRAADSHPSCRKPAIINETDLNVENEMAMPLTKDVRPRPMLEWLEEKKRKEQLQIEASGNPANWDDEDSYVYDEGSGSGTPQDIEPNHHPKSVIQATKDDTKKISLSSSGNPHGPIVVISDHVPPAPDSGFRKHLLGATTFALFTYMIL